MSNLSSADIRDRIIHILKIYHQISPSMLQSGLGPSISASEWRPVLEDMLEKKEVDQNHVITPSPSGRHNTYTRLSLNGILKKELL